MQLALSLLLAHLLGDFIIRTGKWQTSSEKRKIKSAYLWIHVLIHAGLVQLLVQSWHISIIVAMTHLAVDLLMIYNQTETTKR